MVNRICWTVPANDPKDPSDQNDESRSDPQKDETCQFKLTAGKRDFEDGMVFTECGEELDTRDVSIRGPSDECSNQPSNTKNNQQFDAGIFDTTLHRLPLSSAF